MGAVQIQVGLLLKEQFDPQMLGVRTLDGIASVKSQFI